MLVDTTVSGGDVIHSWTLNTGNTEAKMLIKYSIQGVPGTGPGEIEMTDEGEKTVYKLTCDFPEYHMGC